jgi:hypothetical protein
MALRKKEREALTRARVQIVTGQNSFICLALDEVAEDWPELKSAVARLKIYIGNALDGNLALGAWQMAHGIYRSDSQKRSDRLAWIDWMLNESKEA